MHLQLMRELGSSLDSVGDSSCMLTPSAYLSISLADAVLKYPLTFYSFSQSPSSPFPPSPCRSRYVLRYSSAPSIIIITITQIGPSQMQCSQSTCRGGLSCCQTDPTLGAYCITDTFCNAVPPLWETIFIPIFLFLATVGIAIVVYIRYKNLKPHLYTLADFVERELRLEPMERYEHTKLKTITSFE